MFGPYELDILLFLELQAEVEASSVDLGQAFINEYASFRVGLVVRSQPMSLAEYSVSSLPGAEPSNDGRLRVLSVAGDSLWETLISSALKSTPTIFETRTTRSSVFSFLFQASP